jgi:hypothetical protein
MEISYDSVKSIGIFSHNMIVNKLRCPAQLIYLLKTYYLWIDLFFLSGFLIL